MTVGVLDTGAETERATGRGYVWRAPERPLNRARPRDMVARRTSKRSERQNSQIGVCSCDDGGAQASSHGQVTTQKWRCRALHRAPL